HERVGVEHPGQPGRGEVQSALDVRQRDVHDGRVEHDHQLCGGDDSQREARMDVGVAVRPLGTNLGAGNGGHGNGFLLVTSIDRVVGDASVAYLCGFAGLSIERVAGHDSIRVVTQPAGYSGTPLVRKLGVKHDSRLLIVAAPAGFDLDDVPTGAVVHRRAGASSYDVVLAFCPDLDRLQARLSTNIPRLTTAGSLWLAWPKRASGV